jgi:hypothetical protein
VSLPSQSGRQVTRANAGEVAAWVNQGGGHASFDALGPGVVVQTPGLDPRGDLMADPGDWVMRDRTGDFDVWKAAA